MLGMVTPALATSCNTAAWGPQHQNVACAQRHPGEEPPLPQPPLRWVTQPEVKGDAGEKTKDKNQSQCRAKSLHVLVLSIRGGDQCDRGLLLGCALHPASLLRAATYTISQHQPGRTCYPHVRAAVPSAWPLWAGPCILQGHFISLQPLFYSCSSPSRVTLVPKSFLFFSTEFLP